MRKYWLVVVFLLVAVINLVGQSGYQSYYSRGEFSFASPGALKFGLYGFDNPALLNYLHQPDLYFTWSDAGGKWNSFNRWGLFTALPHLGFGMMHEKNGSMGVSDYRISTGFGAKGFSAGLGYGWSGGDTKYFQRKNVFSMGVLIRPVKYFSIGAVGNTATSGSDNDVAIDLAVRPLGNELLTLFGDKIYEHHPSGLPTWSAGAVVEPLPGVRITGRYFEKKSFTLGFELSLGRIGFSTQSYYNPDHHYAYQSYGIRLGALDRSLLGSSILPENRYLGLSLNGQMKYQRYKYFDNSNTLMNILTAIKEAQKDPGIKGIAINTSGMVADREMLWEVREQLKEFKASGKKVVIFIDRGNIDLYHFASVADKIVMDPAGTIMLEGYIMGRTYLKGMLAKLGVGYEEWRFFKYKSAAENYSRDSMSDADREQRQKIVDDYYKLAKSDICASRGFTLEQFDTFVNEKVIFIPDDAVQKRLVDTLGRWDMADEIMKSLDGERCSQVSYSALTAFQLPEDNHWGEAPRIAVIYALGACAMDEGINARSLVRDVEAVVNDPRVKAIVLRVDSPGGDAQASDYIAEALKKCKGKKPVIVSQGYVAASGGYWLSMYADTIVAAPNTITGSIGVIGGWAYNKWLRDTLGMTTDHVQVGAHADLGFGFTLPFIGIGLPDRNLTQEEFAAMETSIRSFYKQFVAKVAVGRKRSVDEIGEIAQGRVWSGFDGLKNGLVDILGGMETAIRVAKERAGIDQSEKVTIVELPEKGWFDLGQFMPKLMPFGVSEDPVMRELKFRIKHNGEPMPMLPLDEMSMEQQSY